MFKLNLEGFKSFFQNKRTLITTHDSVDLDGFVSCIILNFFFQHSFTFSSSIFLPELSSNTKNFIIKVLNKFPEQDFIYSSNEDLSRYNAVIILDTNNLDQVKFLDNFNLLGSNIPFIFIDHHFNLEKDYKNNIKAFNIIEDQFTSTSEIVLKICESFNIELSKFHRYLLCAAILTDSGFFKYANNQTLVTFLKLLNADLNYQEILKDLEYEPEPSEKLARIKALQRLKLIRVNDYLIGITHVSSFEASAANLLVNIGFDVAIVYAEKKKFSRISARARKKVCLKTDLHLGKIMGEISKEFNASGGGHDGAASINCKDNLEIILKSLIAKIKQILCKQK